MTRREPWVWIFSGTAVVMLIAIGIFIWSVLQSKREGSGVTANDSPRAGGGVGVGGYEARARFYPPAYRDLGGEKTPQSAQFRTAIKKYSQRDYAAAIPSLVEVVDAQPDFAEARLYLGICYLFTNNRAAGVAELRKIVAGGSTPYLEQARFYLAKGLLGTGDAAGARQQLEQAIAMHGDMEQQAEALLAQLQ